MKLLLRAINAMAPSSSGRGSAVGAWVSRPSLQRRGRVLLWQGVAEAMDREEVSPESSVAVIGGDVLSDDSRSAYLDEHCIPREHVISSYRRCCEPG